MSKTNFTKEGVFMYYNTQEEIITKITKSLEESLILRKKVIKNLASIILGMILGKSTVVSKIAENLKEDFSEGKEESKIKKIKRFFNKKISEDMYIFFIESVLKKFKAEDNKVVVIFDHTTCEDRFVILSFMLSVGKRGIPLYYKVCDYKDPNNKSMKDVKEGLERVKKILQPYGYEVTVLADRGFGSTELFEYIDKMGWTYYIRVKGNYNIRIEKDEVIGKIEDIEHPRGFTRYFYNVELTQSKYEWNIATRPSGKEKEDNQYIATNGNPQKAINNYKRRFTIEEMFKNMKSNGLGMEDTWTKKLEYFKNIMLCINIAYVYLITVGSECAKNGRNKEFGAFVKTKRANKTRVYSIFQIGRRWLQKCYFSKVERKLVCEFILYDLQRGGNRKETGMQKQAGCLKVM